MENPKDYEINDKIQMSVAGKAPCKIPSYYGDGKLDPYKIARVHNLSAAQAHAIKYIVRAGKKPGVSYQQDMQNAKNAIDRDVELYEEGVTTMFVPAGSFGATR